MGWFTGNLLGSNFIAHDGRGWGAAASLVYFPGEKIFVVALSNCSYCSWDAGDFYYSPFRIASILMGKKYSADASLSKETLPIYEAVYQSDIGESRTIVADGNSLKLRHDDGRFSQIFGYKNDLFYIEDTYETLKFNKAASGKIISVISNKRIPITFKRTAKKLPPKSLSQAVLNITLEKGIGEGLEFFQNFKNSDKYYVQESEINNVGYTLIQRKKIKEAIEIFKLNTTEFPNSANAFDSLAEAYFANKNYELSLANYKKSLELNPENKKC